MAITPDEDRLRALFSATLALNSELSLDSLLQRLVETAAALTGAQYAALGVIDESGTALERFMTTGIDAETHAAIGELPRGRSALDDVRRRALAMPEATGCCAIRNGETASGMGSASSMRAQSAVCGGGLPPSKPLPTV